MQVGCGFRVMVVKNREYVYCWHYEDRGARSHQVYEYMGSKSAARTARRLSDAIEAYYAKAGDTLRRELGRQRDSIAALRA